MTRQPDLIQLSIYVPCLVSFLLYLKLFNIIMMSYKLLHNTLTSPCLCVWVCLFLCLFVCVFIHPSTIICPLICPFIHPFIVFIHLVTVLHGSLIHILLLPKQDRHAYLIYQERIIVVHLLVATLMPHLLHHIQNLEVQVRQRWDKRKKYFNFFWFNL